MLKYKHNIRLAANRAGHYDLSKYGTTSNSCQKGAVFSSSLGWGWTLKCWLYSFHLGNIKEAQKKTQQIGVILECSYGEITHFAVAKVF